MRPIPLVIAGAGEVAAMGHGTDRGYRPLRGSMGVGVLAAFGYEARAPPGRVSRRL